MCGKGCTKSAKYSWYIKKFERQWTNGSEVGKENIYIWAKKQYIVSFENGHKIAPLLFNIKITTKRKK